MAFGQGPRDQGSGIRRRHHDEKHASTAKKTVHRSPTPTQRYCSKQLLRSKQTTRPKRATRPPHKTRPNHTAPANMCTPAPFTTPSAQTPILLKPMLPSRRIHPKTWRTMGPHAHTTILRPRHKTYTPNHLQPNASALTEARNEQRTPPTATTPQAERNQKHLARCRPATPSSNPSPARQRYCTPKCKKRPPQR